MRTLIRIQKGSAVVEEKHEFPGDHIIQAMRAATSLLEARNQGKEEAEREVLLSVKQIFQRSKGGYG